MTSRRISVVIPCADMARFLGDAVASILGQGEPVEEIIVVRPERDLETAARCDSLCQDSAPVRCEIVREPGPAAARNVGIEAARSEIVAFCDADDLWTSDKLSRQLNRLDESPKVDLVGGMSLLFDRLDRKSLAPSDDSQTKRMLWINMGIFVFRKSVFETVGLMDTDFRYAEDVDFLLRIRDANIKLAILQDVVLYYRQHKKSMMRTDDDRKFSDFRKAMLRSVLRRRKLGLPPATGQFLIDQIEPPPESPADWGLVP